MRTINIAGNKVEIYDNIEDLPITRFHKYNKMLLIDAGVGSDLTDIDRHIERAIRFSVKDPQKAATELHNLRLSIYFVQNEISPRNMAFAALVKSINKKEYNDLSDEGLRKIVEILSDATQKEITDHLGSVKKKINNELHLYFPSLFDDVNVKEYHDKLKGRTMLVLQSIISGENKDKEIDDITGDLMMYYKPQSFTGKNSAEIQYDKQFETMCISLAQNLYVKPKEFTVLEFYNAFEYLKEQEKKIKQRNRAK